MNQAIVCQFSHNASLHARDNSFRIIGRDGLVTKRLATLNSPDNAPICGAVFLRENVVHVFTTLNVYEVNGEDGRLQVLNVGHFL